MMYFANFDIKIMVQRVIIVALGMFTAYFGNDWLANRDLTLALNAGLDTLVKGVVAGITLDQLMFNFGKNSKN